MVYTLMIIVFPDAVKSLGGRGRVAIKGEYCMVYRVMVELGKYNVSTNVVHIITII